MLAVQITGGHKQTSSQDPADRRDAATSVGGLTSTHRQPLPASNLGGVSDHQPAASDAAEDAAVGTSSGTAPHSDGAGGTDGGDRAGSEPRRTSSSRYGGGPVTVTESSSSMEKLHALYARFLSDSHTPQRRSTADGALEQQAGASSTGVGRQPRRTAGVPSTIGTAPVTAPMRSSMPYPLAAMAGVAPAEGAAGRRCHSVSPQKEPRRSHALSHNNLQEHQQQHQQQHPPGYVHPHQLQHSLSLCSSCGGPMLQRDISAMSSRAASAAVLAAQGPAAAAVLAGGLHSPVRAAASVADAAALGLRTVSDALPSTHISISNLLAEGLVASTVARLERQMSPQPEHSAPVVANSRGGPGSPPPPLDRLPAQHSRSLPRNGGGELSPRTSSGGRGRHSSASPVRGRGGSYTDRFASSPAHRTASATHVADSSRRALSSSPDKRSHRALGTAPAEASCSDITLSQEGVGVTSITFGQLLQESALQHAMGQLEQAGVDSILSGVGSSIGIGSSTNSRYAVLGPAAAADGVGVAEGSAGVQVLNTVPEHGIVTAAAGSQPVLRRTHSRTGSRHRLVLPSQLDTCIAAASDSLQPPVHCAEPLVTSEQQARRASLIHSSSLQHERHTLSRSSSAVDRRLTASSSMKSRTSTASSTSSRVWRPGGNRTDPKDDYRKLQTYESARLRALQRQGLLSPGCSSRNLLLHEAGGLSPPGSASPKSRRSTSHDLASPVSPGALTGPSIISGALKTTPHSPSPSPSPGGYGAASARRQALAAAAAGGAGAGSGAPSTRQRASPGRAPAAGQGRLKAAAAKPAGLRSVLEPAQTAVSLTGLVGGSSTSSLSAPQKCTSPRLRKQEQQQQSQPKQQDIWLALTGQPCPASLLPMLQRLQHSGGGAGAGAGTGAGSPRGRSPYGSMSAQSSPERLRTGGDRAQRALSRSYPSGGNSTTVQVEEAIRAAQAALLQKQQQVLQVRRALSAPRYGAAAGRGGHGLSQSPGSRLHREQDGVSTVAAAGLDSLPDSSFWDGSSAASSYTGVVAAGKEQSTPRDLAAAFDPASPDAGAPPAASLSAGEQHHHQQQQGEDAAATAGAAGVPEGSKATPRHGSSSHDGVSGQTGSRPGSRQAGGFATVSAPLQHLAQAAVAVAEVKHHSKEAAVTSTNAAKGAPAESLYSLVTVTAAAPSSPRSPPPAPAVNPGSPRSSPADPSRSKQAYRSPVAYHSRHKSHSPKRRPISALEALLKVAPSEGSDGGCQQQHVRPSSAEPAFASQLASGGRTVSGPVLPQRRSSQHNPVLPATATAADISGTHGSSSKAGGVSGPRISSSNTARRSSGGGSLGGSTYLAEPWSAPAGRNAAGLTGEQLLAQHRRMSAAEAAEAAAAAAEGDDEVAGCAEHVMPLDALVRAYTALNKKNKNTSERAAAVAMLLDRITEGASHGGEGSSSLRSTPRNLDTAGAAVSQQLAGEGSPEQQQLKLRSSPFTGIEGMRLDVLGRGLSPESPPGVGGGSGSVGGPSSPSTIIKTLKEDSLSAWQRVSPERQAAHATLLATPKHKHASSYAAGLAALAAGSSSTNLHAEKSVHRGIRGPESPGPVETGSAGKQQPIPADSSSNSPGTSGEAQQPGTGSSNEHSPLHQAREGSVTGAGAARGCTALRHARVSSSTGSVAASDVSPSHPQEGSPLHTQPTLPPAVECPEPRPMVDTATGRLALGTIGAHEMTVAAALTWLKAGLQSSDAPAAAPPPSSPRHRRPGSPRRLGHSRPCSPFSCFGGKGDSRGMVRSSDEGGEGEAMPASPSAAAVKEQLNQQQQQQQVPQQEAGVDGVTFEMGGDNRLVMVVRQPGGAATAPQKLAVTGMRLRPVRSSQPGARSAGGEGAAAAGSTVGIAMVESSSCALDLLTTGGAHTIELASESDWAGLVVGLNGMLLLLEQEGPEAVQQMGAITMSQAAWSKAVTGVE